MKHPHSQPTRRARPAPLRTAARWQSQDLTLGPSLPLDPLTLALDPQMPKSRPDPAPVPSTPLLSHQLAGNDSRPLCFRPRSCLSVNACPLRSSREPSNSNADRGTRCSQSTFKSATAGTLYGLGRLDVPSLRTSSFRRRGISALNKCSVIQIRASRLRCSSSREAKARN